MTKRDGLRDRVLRRLPVNFRRTEPILFENKREIENLHKLFTLSCAIPSSCRSCAARSS
jgi:hypothetical protein